MKRYLTCLVGSYRMEIGISFTSLRRRYLGVPAEEGFNASFLAKLAVLLCGGIYRKDNKYIWFETQEQRDHFKWVTRQQVVFDPFYDDIPF